MKKLFAIALLATVVLPVSVLCAASKVTSASSKATATPAASASEQLAQATRLWRQMNQKTAPAEKLDLFAQTWANLALVRQVWPNDKTAFVRSGVMQADLAAEF